MEKQLSEVEEDHVSQRADGRWSQSIGRSDGLRKMAGSGCIRTAPVKYGWHSLGEAFFQ